MLGTLIRRQRWTVLLACAVVTAPMSLLTGSASLTGESGNLANTAVMVPEHQDVQSLDPTAMKDIRAANPTSGVNLVEPPVANDSGDANLSYPIQVPPGRQGLEPKLRLTYDSGASNGWLGLGWELTVPTVTVDTRWGVPRYLAGTETESYALNGQQLTPLAHRGPAQARVADKEFHSRVESGFAKIVRHGTLPTNYFWEVRDKLGIRSFYGGVPETGQDANAVLADDAGHVFKWGLREVRDLHGNSVVYTWAKQTDPGVLNGNVTGTELYPKTIRYTSTATTPGKYLVTFTRDRELPGWVRRPDITIDAKAGALRVNADLLRRIDISFDGALLRSYDLVYAEGAFRKMLLASVEQRGEGGVPFNKHTFTYHDDARAVGGQYRFGDVQPWNTGQDNLSTGAFDQGHPSALGGSVTTSIGGHLYVGVNVAVGTKMLSGGGKVGYLYNTTDEVLALTDVNGDTLPDKVFKRSDGFYFRPNLSGPSGGTVFGAAVKIPSLPAIGTENSSTISFGGEIYVVANGLANHADTFTNGTAYFRDVNGDGLADLVNGQQVLFNHVVNGLPTFSTDSSVTPAPLPNGTIDSGDVSPDLTDVYNQMLAKNPPHDTLRRWVAPFDGTVKIFGDVALVNTDRQGYQTADGVRVAIQHNEDELFAATINGDDFAAKTPTEVDEVAVQKGDRIYFRVQTRLDGAFDQVSWDPRIEYLNAPTSTDVNFQPHYQYRASTDFALTGRPSTTVNMPFTGTVRVQGALHKKAVTTDDLLVQILHNGTVAFEQSISRSTVDDIDLSFDMPVAKDDTAELRVRVDSPIAAQQIEWKPQLFYLTAPPNQQVVDANGNHVIQLYPPYSIDVYPVDDLTAPQQPFTVGPPMDQEVTLDATPNIQFTGDPTTNATVAMTIKRQGQLLAKAQVRIVNGVVQPVTVPVTFQIGEPLYFDYSNRDPQITAGLSNFTVTLSAGIIAILVPAVLHSAAPRGIFAPDYRQWSYAGYNGAGDRANQPVHENLLVADDNFDPNSYDPTTATAYPFTVFPAESSWRGPAGCSVQSPALSVGGLTPEYCRTRASWATGDRMSSARAGAPHVPVPTEGIAAGRGVSRFSTSDQNSVGGGFGFLSGSTTDGGSSGDIDFIDMNGDSFPDAVGDGKVLYSNPDGSLPDDPEQPGLDGIRNNDDDANNLGIGGNPAAFFANSRGDVDTNAKGQAKGNDTASQLASYGFAINASLGGGSSTTESELFDVNGDGLPDQVTRVVEDNQLKLKAALNLGYGFTDPQPWGSAEINDGDSDSQSVGGGFNDGIYSFGGGASVSFNHSTSGQTLLDINGDGLLDRVVANGNKLSVGLNTGDGLPASSVDWLGTLTNKVGSNDTFSLAGGVYFTIGIGPLCLAGCYVIINPGADVSQTVSRPEASIRDVNGDGFPDATTSDTDGNLQVAPSTIGRTNLLKTVSRPLGAVMTLDYARSGNTYDEPQSHFVLSRLVVTDGHPGDGVDSSVTTYRYEGGLFDRFEREFYGYRTVVQEQRNPAGNQPLYRSVVREYADDSYYTKGLLKRETTRDAAGNLFAETVHSYDLRNVDTGTAGNPQDRSATIFPQLTRTDRRFYEGAPAPAKSTFATFEYDSLGEMTRTLDTGDDGSDDDLLTELTYTDCPGTRVHQANSVKATGGGALLRRREATIDCATGNVTQVRSFLATGAAAVTDLTYENNGNIASVTNPANKVGQRYATTYEYDGVTQTYVTKVTDNIGHQSTASYDFKYGQPVSSVDANGNPTTRLYDGFGRLTEVRGPYEQSTVKPTVAFEYHPEASTPWAISRHLDPFRSASDTVDNVVFVDGLAREIQTKRDATVYTGDSTAPVDRMIVSGRVVFDLAGRAADEFYPTTESLGLPGVFNTDPPDGIAPTHTDYDVLDRQTLVRLPDNTTTSYAYGFGPDRGGVTRLRTTTTDANLISQQTFADVRGKQVALRETHNGQPLWTSFGYDALGQLTTASDANNNTTRVEYDSLGRKLSVESPDSGKTLTAYDLTGNVIEKATATLQGQAAKVTYDYDFTRLIRINYPTFPANNVTYVYGTPGAANNRAGRIVSVTDGSGSKQLFYGKLGETIRETETVISETAGPETYTTQYVYDTFGRLQNLTYADGEVVTYQYDSGGLPRQVTGVKQGFSYNYLQRLEYDKFGQRALLLDGNGVKTNFAYVPDSRRLQSITTVKGTAPYQKLLYTYDPVGNLKTFVNDIPIPPPNQFGGPSTQTFTYDDLYRLTNAVGQYQHSGDKTNKYATTIAYDNIHNIVSKVQTNDVVQSSGQVNPVHETTYSFAYTYGGPRPHAPTKVGSLNFSYDASGCQIGWTNDQNSNRRDSVFDEDGRIKSITTNGQEITYRYDDAGNRVVKRGPAGETIYVNQYLTIRDSQVAQKDIFVGSTRLATKLAKQTKPGGGGGTANPFEKDLFMYHPDHTGSSRDVTDVAGLVFQHNEYFPYGETWVKEKSNIEWTPNMFTGKELDEETGLYYVGARYYDPRISQFLSTDPALAKGPEPALDNAKAVSVYGYGINNPTRYIDPEGLDPKDTLTRVANGQENRLSNGESNQRLRLPGLPTWIPPVAHYDLSVAYNGPLLTRDPGLPSGQVSLSLRSNIPGLLGKANGSGTFADGQYQLSGTFTAATPYVFGASGSWQLSSREGLSVQAHYMGPQFKFFGLAPDLDPVNVQGAGLPAPSLAAIPSGPGIGTIDYFKSGPSYGYTYFRAHVPNGSSLTNAQYFGFSVGVAPIPSLVSYNPVQPPLPPIPGAEQLLYGHSTSTDTGKYGVYIGGAVFGTLPLQF